MPLTIDKAMPGAPFVCIWTPEPFSSGWNRIAGIHVDGDRLQIYAREYFFRYDNPSPIPVVSGASTPARPETKRRSTPERHGSLDGVLNAVASLADTWALAC